MRVGIIQSNYLPWRGYFDFIRSVDLFVFHDDLQYTKGDWRNRNRIKSNSGTVWLTVPVRCSSSRSICETPIDYSQRWQNKHINRLRQWYNAAPFFTLYLDQLTEILLRRFDSISSLNVELCLWVMNHLDIKTPTVLSSVYTPVGPRTDRLIDLLKKLEATHYLSGPTAKSYLDEKAFEENGIVLEYKSYDYPPYPQLWDGFIGEVSIVDLLFNAGADARKYLVSRSPDTVVSRGQSILGSD